MKEITTEELFDLSNSIAGPMLSGTVYPWEALSKIKDLILELGRSLPVDEYDEVSPSVWIAKDAKVAESAQINPPCIIGRGAEIRQCAFIRGSAIVGDGAVVGNSCELKNCILFNKVQVPHFNYVGDSILGFKSHMGAGAITSNVKSDKTLVSTRVDGKQIPTELKKMGAILGDNVEVGCNSVLNPGTIVGKNTNIYPLSFVRGYVPANHIFKSSDNIVLKN